MIEPIITAEKLATYAQSASEVRHLLHQKPEVGLKLTETEKIIISRLQTIGCKEIHTQVGGKNISGIVAVIHGLHPGKTIGLRADSDALALTEKTNVSYISTHDGCMHACGHDGHVATLLAVCHYLCEHRDFAGTVVAIFQPGEEGFAGARLMIEDGLVERFQIDEFYALHADPLLPVGQVSFTSGYSTANADAFEVTFEGKGGHGSRPQYLNDTVVAMGEAIGALQTIASRNASPDDTCVVSICYAKAGDSQSVSVVPQEATFGGTTRSYQPEVRDLIEKRIGEICNGIALAYNIKAHYHYKRLYPSMYNTPELVKEAKRLSALCIGEENIKDLGRKPGGEDFSFMLNARPGCLFRLGVCDKDHQAALHSSGFDFNDKAITVGATLLLNMALNRMAA